MGFFNKRNANYPFFSILFGAAAFWNLIGAGFGYFNTAYTFHELFGRELNDPLIYAIYQGSWGTTLLYFIGYLIVAYNPIKHVGIVILGAVGKVFFAVKMMELYSHNIASDLVLIIVIGDFIFTALFFYYFYFMIKETDGII